MKILSFNKSILLILVSILLFLASCNSGGYKINQDTKTGQTAYYQFKIDFPQYKGIHENIFNKEMNAYLKKQVFNIAKQSRLICERDNEPNNLLPTLTVTYEVLQQDEVYVTLRFSTYIDWNNDLSPSQYYDCFNFSVKDGHFIHIQDYLQTHFSDQERAVRALTRICQLKMFNEDEIFCRSFWKSEKEIDVFENFSITSHDLHLKFDNVIFETNMCGNPEVVFTETELKEAYQEVAKK